MTTGLDGVLEELREIARGLHPAVLAHRGLRPALKTLASRARRGLVSPADLDVQPEGILWLTSYPADRWEQ
ncbi:MAG TPA: hypothetical protein VME44_00075 [Streptosporangiaceae bacterium]|nr:hypothetical protein [Streptosporangiaceae bacterium]